MSKYVVLVCMLMGIVRMLMVIVLPAAAPLNASSKKRVMSSAVSGGSLCGVSDHIACCEASPPWGVR